MLDRLRYGFGADGKARKRAREAARREASFNEQFADRESALPQRRYASYDDYVAHQASKLERIERRLRRVEDEDLDSFRANFAGCRALDGRHAVLCLGARLGTEVRALQERGHLAIGIDLNPGQDNPYVLPGDFHDLVFADGSFAAVYTNALDHLFDLPRLAAEIQRVLAPDGVLIADVAPGFEEGQLPGAFEATAWPKIDELVRALGDAGLRLVSRRRLDRAPWQQLILVPAAAENAGRRGDAQAVPVRPDDGWTARGRP